MNIGEYWKTHRVEPAVVPEPLRETKPPQKAPDTPRRREAPQRKEPAKTPDRPVKEPVKR